MQIAIGRTGTLSHIRSLRACTTCRPCARRVVRHLLRAEKLTGGGTRFEEEMEFMPFEDEEGTELEMLPANVG